MSRCAKINNSRGLNLKERGDKNFSFFKSNGRSFGLPSKKSRSLDTIFEELSKDETNEPGKKTKEGIPLKLHKPLIPRIKLTKRRARENDPKDSYVMSSEPYSLNSWGKPEAENETLMIDNEYASKQSSITSNDFIQKKPDDNYFTKNFDECIKRLQLLEKEHELMEGDNCSDQLFYLKKEKNQKSSDETGTIDGVESTENIAGHSIDEDNPNQTVPLATVDCSELTCGSPKVTEENFGDKLEKYQEKVTEPDNDANKLSENDNGNNESSPAVDEKQELISEWYSNLKRRFEMNDQEPKEEKSKEMSCRITGATLKNSSKTNKAESDEDENTRYYFSKLVKSNRSLIDEELPDPDMVKSIRAKFQENLNYTLKNRLTNNLGGSLQNINSGKVQSQRVWRPLSVQCNRDDVIREIQNTLTANQKEKIAGTTNSSESIKDSDKESSSFSSKTRTGKKFEKDLKTSRDFRTGRLFASKWTDSGSVSSGVSSDLSSYDTDLEPGPEPEPYDTITLSDDDLLDEVKDKHYVQNEILEKIRSFGTSVTYYGGEMITCSVGSLLSPTAQAIMEEITEKYKKDKNISRTFDEFYGKYAETNDLYRKRKVGRAKSFGQTDVFQKQNTLSNTEIEMYKYDLEVEIGIRKPKGLQQAHSKLHESKSNNQKNHLKFDEHKESQISTKTDEAETKTEKNQVECAIKIIVEESAPQADDSTTEIYEEISSKSETNNSEQSENKNLDLDEHREPIQTKQRLERSHSTPHEIMDGSTSSREDFELFKASPIEISVECDKPSFEESGNSEVRSEEVQVCEGDTEKGQNLAEVSSPSLESSTVEFQEKNADEEVIKIGHKEENLKTANSINHNFKHEEKDDGEDYRVHSKSKKKNNLRWPIETRGVIDIQNSVQSPGIVIFSSGMSPKPGRKSKIRLF